MEGITTVNASDLTKIFNQLTEMRSEITALKEQQEQTMAFSIQHTAEKLGLHYNSVRRLVMRGKLFAKFLDGKAGKCMIPFWSIKEYLKSKENSNHKI